ncbi:uncharacterized protein LOC131325224 [Rhododendron vialii]|uniref:uncharacterized protein LOC131325224 n=1 Tax=Rhododendron vialii TaxID=182163 RepID=UPI00265E628F|nr:uncharacterized protein LOC131325224 [Rhododendron vialii]
MAVTTKQLAAIVAVLGVISFIFGVAAERNKPPAGEPIQGKGVVICKYPSDPSIPYGYLSAVFLVACTGVGYFSLFYPYQGKSVPQSAFFSSHKFTIFFNIAMVTAGFATALLLYTTISEHFLLTHNVHHDLDTQCPTAKTGLLGGAAFASLDSALFWLVALMMGSNVREDYFGETESGDDYGDANSVVVIG